jgi:site-specific DNA-methyltransferase (adenine-specific)
MKTDLLDIRHMDCMDLMAGFPDNHFDLAVVDPPYGIGAEQGTNRAARLQFKG